MFLSKTFIIYKTEYIFYCPALSERGCVYVIAQKHVEKIIIFSTHDPNAR